MAYIGIKPAESFTSFATQTFSTSATSSYTLDHAVTNENELALFINNVRQQPGSGKAYTATGTALTLSANTASTDTMYAIFLGRALQTVNPASASVGSSQITAEMITGTTALAAEPADTDEFLISDAGTLKRLDYSHIKASNPGLVHIKTQTASGVSSVDFAHGTGDVILDSTYDKYLFSCDYKPANDNVTPQLFISVDAGSSFITANYVYGMDGFEAGGSAITRQSGSDSQIELSPDTQGGAADEMMSYNIYLSMPARANTHKLFTFVGTTMDAASNLSPCSGAGACTGSTAAVDGVRFKFSAGNIEFGTFTLFGVSKG